MQFITTATLNNKNMLSKIKFRTCFSSISHHGYKLDILKSAMQKYLRRKEKNKMIWCVAEIYLFQVFSKTEKEKKIKYTIFRKLTMKSRPITRAFS